MAMQINLGKVPGLFSEDFGQLEQGDPPCSSLVRQARRQALLQERPLRRAGRIATVFWRALQPSCLSTLLPTFDLLWREKTIGAAGLPDPDMALAKPDGLAGLAPDLTAATLVSAYERGLHPRCLAGPATFWAPARRLTAHPANLRLDSAIRGHLHRADLGVALDRDFDAVIEACAASGPIYQRLNPKLVKAHVNLFDAGVAHSFEVRGGTGTLTAGGYGVAVGRSFVLERWFGALPVARFGLAVLARHLAAWGFKMIDATNAPELAAGMGYVETPRKIYNVALETNLGAGRPGNWRIDPLLFAPRPQNPSLRHLFDKPAIAVRDATEMARTHAELLAMVGAEHGPARCAAKKGVVREQNAA